MATAKDLLGMLPAYQLDKGFYDRVRAAKPRYQLVDKLIIPPLTARAFIVKRGQTFRIIQERGPQAAVVALWNAENPKEFYNPMRSRVPEGVFMTVYTRLWSEIPWLVATVAPTSLKCAQAVEGCQAAIFSSSRPLNRLD